MSTRMATKGEAAECDALQAELAEILGTIEKPRKEPLTDEERARIADIDLRLEKFKHLAKYSAVFSGGDSPGFGLRGFLGGDIEPIGVSDGRPVYMLSPEQRLTDLPSRSGERAKQLSVGKLIRGLVTSKWDGAEGEHESLAMSGAVNSGGGWLVPDDLSRQVIDLARARAVCMQAGARTLVMNSDRTTIAKISADPTFAVVAENVEISEDSTLAFTAVALTSRKLACLVAASRELIEDAPNAADLIEQTLVKALGSEIDRIMIAGDGNPAGEPNGILNWSGISSTSSVGNILWEDLHAAVTAVRESNHEPNAYIVHPTIAGDCDILAGGDGSSTTKVWLGPPPSLENVKRFVTTNCPLANAIAGDFTNLVLGVRSGALLETTTTGSDSFKKFQTLIRMVLRCDVAVLDTGAFYFLSGITS